MSINSGGGGHRERESEEEEVTLRMLAEGRGEFTASSQRSAFTLPEQPSVRTHFGVSGVTRKAGELLIEAVSAARRCVGERHGGRGPLTPAPLTPLAV